MIPLKQVVEISWGIGVVIGSVLLVAVAQTAPNELFRMITENYGPIGIAVYVLYRRIDQLEEKVSSNTEAINNNH